MILTSGGMDDIATKYLVEAGVLGLRRVDKHDLRRIAKASGGILRKINWKYFDFDCLFFI